MATLREEYDTLSKRGILTKDIPEFIKDNLNPAFELRPYQNEAISRFINYFEKDPTRIKPSQLLFHMATGSGKTLLMATNILYLYNKGYRNFLFFVNNINTIEKTRDNLLKHDSSKYLFSDKIKFDGNETHINEVSNFETSNSNDINILFTTIQSLHSNLNMPKEDILTYEDFKDKQIVIISDEAHHINAWTKNKLREAEAIAKSTWELTVNNIFKSNVDNVMLEYTATVDLSNSGIYDKYQDKILYEYSLKQFRQDGYSKEVKVMQADLDNVERMLQAMVLSQYRRKIAEDNKIHLKPVILFKSRTIKDSKQNEENFRQAINNLRPEDFQKIKTQSNGNVLQKVFEYFDMCGISFDNLITELKEDFSEEKCILLDSNNIDEEKQLKLNSLEDPNNEIRAIFAVDMLNEGWDVLNLFDIVRLYNTRDSQGNRLGKTTIAEAQLIGRGARYFPFKLRGEQDKYKRKYDNDLENDLKIIEELYYHSAHNPRYIQELTIALRESGIMPPQEPKVINLKVKEGIKESEFWKNGLIFTNDRIEVDRSQIRDISDIDVSNNFGVFSLRSGSVQDLAIFVDQRGIEEERVTKQFNLSDFNIAIKRKALQLVDFYKFDNLQKYFPKLESMIRFIESLNQIKVDVRSSKLRLANLNPDDKVSIMLKVLNQLELQIKGEYTDYKGTKLFTRNRIKDVVSDKILNINVGDYSDQEFGIAMSLTTKEELRLTLADKDWYIYDENYGTSEEKYYIQFLHGIMEKLKQKYSEIYLLQNASLFKLYAFSDGKATEPDFVLFARKEGQKELIQYQLFIEPKGNHLLKADQWKEEFLREIESNYEVQTLEENESYKLIGLPFFNEGTRANFITAFKEKMDLN